MPVLAPEREALAPPAVPSPPGASAPAARMRPGDAGAERRRPHGPRGRGFLRALGVVVLAGLALVGFDRVRDLVPSFENPFASETVDRTGPAVLRALDDLHRYEGATGSFQAYIDVEKDAKYVPDFLKGERTIFLATGGVDAGVDFSAIGPDAVAVSPDGRSVTITLPRATLSQPRIDPKLSRVLNRDRGLLDRVGSVFSDSPTSEREFYLMAEPKLTAAAAEAGLVERAEANTRVMLENLLRPLGVEQVTVHFVDGAGAAPSRL